MLQITTQISLTNIFITRSRSQFGIVVATENIMRCCRHTSTQNDKLKQQ